MPLRIPEGEHTLNLLDSYGDGWHGGFFELTNTDSGTLLAGGETDGQVPEYGRSVSFILGSSGAGDEAGDGVSDILADSCWQARNLASTLAFTANVSLTGDYASCGEAGGQEAVVFYTVPAGGSITFTPTVDWAVHETRWGGTCPGDNLVTCSAAGEMESHSITNTREDAQNFYIIIHLNGDETAPTTVEIDVTVDTPESEWTLEAESLCFGTSESPSGRFSLAAPANGIKLVHTRGAFGCLGQDDTGVGGWWGCSGITGAMSTIATFVSGETSREGPNAIVAPPFQVRSGLSCAHILDSSPGAGSGTYRLTPPGLDPFDAYCDMSVTDGGGSVGGWTLVATRESGTATEEVADESLNPEQRGKAVTAAQWEYLRTTSTDLMIRMRGSQGSAPRWIRNLDDGFELYAIVPFSTLNSLRCLTLTEANLTDTLLVHDRVSGCDLSLEGDFQTLGGFDVDTQTSVNSGSTGQQFQLFETMFVYNPRDPTAYVQTRDVNAVRLEFDSLDIYVRGEVSSGQYFAFDSNSASSAELVFGDTSTSAFPRGDYNLWLASDFFEQSDGSREGSVCVDVYTKAATALLAYYSFDGSSVEDSSGNQRHGEVAGRQPGDTPDLQYVDDGISGQAARFDGNTKINVPAFAGFQWGSAFSVSFWFRRTGGAGLTSLVFAGQCWKVIMPSGSSVAAGVSTSASPAADEMTQSANLFSWQHVALVYNGDRGEAKLFVDGVKITSSADEGSTGECVDALTPLVIGSEMPVTAPSGLVGDIDELRVYLLALSDDDVTLLYSSPGGSSSIGRASGITCAHILEDNPEAVDGTYRLTPPGLDPFDAYCDMTAADSVSAGGWTLVTTRDSGTTTEEVTEGSLSPDRRQLAVTTAQWQYLQTMSTQILIRLRGESTTTVDGCADCDFEELEIVVETSALSSYSCKSWSQVSSLIETALFLNSSSACNYSTFDQSDYTMLLGSDPSDAAGQTAVKIVGAVDVFWNSTSSVDGLYASTDIELLYAMADVYIRGSTATEINSCAHVLANDPAATSGVYRLTPAALDPFDVYCDMSITDGVSAGGWTLVTTRDSGFVTQELADSALSPSLRQRAVTAAQWEYLLDLSNEVVVVMSTALGRLTDRIEDPHTFNWGNAQATNRVVNGGLGMYGGNGGNILSTSLCESVAYDENFNQAASECFGSGSAYFMDTTPNKLVLVTKNVHDADISFNVGGQLGAGGFGLKETFEFSSSGYSGYVTSTCSASVASVNHLFIVSTTADVTHVSSESTASDDDSIHGIAPGSALLYMLYSSAGGHCMSESQHSSLFEAAVPILDRYVESETAPVAPTFRMTGICQRCELAESIYAVIPTSVLGTFSCRDLKDNANLTGTVLAHQETTDCDFRGGDFSTFLGFRGGRVGQQNRIKSGARASDPYIDKLFTSKFDSEGTFTGEMVDTQGTRLNLNFEYADLYLRGEVASYTTGAATDVEVTVRITVRDWGDEINWRIDHGRPRGPYRWNSVIEETLTLATGRHNMVAIDLAHDGWHGGTWEIWVGETLVAGPAEVAGSGSTTEFLLTAPEACVALTEDDLLGVADGQCRGTLPGQRCPYTCSDGLKPVYGSTSSAQCEGGSWNVGNAACVVPCSSPGENEVPHIVPGLCDETPAGGPCDFSCTDGFYKHENAIPAIYCGSDGSWNIGLAECLDEGEEDPDVTYPGSCAHLKAAFSFLPSGLYFIRPNANADPFLVFVSETARLVVLLWCWLTRCRWHSV